jgi:hypothetical protein
VVSGNLAEKFRQQLRKQIWLIRTLQVLTSIFLPIVEGISVNIATSNSQGFLWWLVVGMLGVIHLVLFIALFGTEYPLPAFLIEFDDLMSQLEITQNELAEFERYNTVSEQSILVFGLNLVSILESRQNSQLQAEMYKKILEPWIRFRQDIFWFDRVDALHNFAIYLQDPASKKLSVCARICHPEMKRKDRSWEVGEGHIGICFSTKRPQFSNDASKAETARTGNTRDEDVEYYRSLIAHPIRLEHEVIGVLIITSSVAMQFDEVVHIPILQAIAGLLNIATIHPSIKSL